MDEKVRNELAALIQISKWYVVKSIFCMELHIQWNLVIILSSLLVSELWDSFTDLFVSHSCTYMYAHVSFQVYGLPSVCNVEMMCKILSTM